jgi:hypothetical protein
MNQPLPLARTESLIIKELADETLVYDSNNDKAHCLNPTAALVWKNCDGKQTVDQLRELMEHEAGAAVPEEMIWLALDQLASFNLLAEAPAKPVALAGLNRRTLVKRIGFAAIALPVILSIAAPPAHAQGSKFGTGVCCTQNSQCASGSCTQAPTCTGGIPGPSTKACT